MKVEATIAKPAEDVWDVLTDWSRAHEWMGVEWIKADGETIAGTKLAFFARGKERPSEIAECQPGRMIVLRSVQGGVSADYAYTLDPIDDNTTRVTLVANCRTRGLLWGAASPLLRVAIRLTDEKQIKNLKRIVEAN